MLLSKPHTQPQFVFPRERAWDEAILLPHDLFSSLVQNSGTQRANAINLRLSISSSAFYVKIKATQACGISSRKLQYKYNFIHDLQQFGINSGEWAKNDFIVQNVTFLLLLVVLSCHPE